MSHMLLSAMQEIVMKRIGLKHPTTPFSTPAKFQCRGSHVVTSLCAALLVISYRTYEMVVERTSINTDKAVRSNPQEAVVAAGQRRPLVPWELASAGRFVPLPSFAAAAVFALRVAPSRGGLGSVLMLLFLLLRLHRRSSGLLFGCR